MTGDPALETLAAEAADVAEIFRRRIDQIRLGHTAEADDDRPAHLLAQTMINMAITARDVTLPGERQDLQVAYARAAKTGALAIALMRRLRRDMERAAAREAEPVASTGARP